MANTKNNNLKADERKENKMELTINGIEYKVYMMDGNMVAEEISTGLQMVIKEGGELQTKGGIRKAILREKAKLENEDAEVTEAEYEEEMMEESRHGEFAGAFESACAEIQEENSKLMEFYKRNWRKYTERFDPLKFERLVESGKIKIEDVETSEEEEVREFVEEIAEATEPTRTINDVIYRNLPKYVQKAIDYCDYVEGVYRIHVNTEFGSTEIQADKWADASASAKAYCKTGKLN